MTAYAQRLTPPWWVWTVALVGASPLGVAYGAAYGTAAGWIVYAVTAAIVVAALVATSPRVTVIGSELRAGRARIPVELLGRVVALDAERARAARTADGDPDAYLVIRTWCSLRAVLVEIDDPTDPHPYWLITAREPTRLAAAIEASRANA